MEQAQNKLEIEMNKATLIECIANSQYPAPSLIHNVLSFEVGEDEELDRKIREAWQSAE